MSESAQAVTPTFGEHMRMRPGMYMRNLSIIGFFDITKSLLEETTLDATAPVVTVGVLSSERVTFSVNHISITPLLKLLELVYEDERAVGGFWALLLFLYFGDPAVITFRGEGMETIFTGKAGKIERSANVYNGTGNELIIDFKIDRTILPGISLMFEMLVRPLSEYAMLRPQCKIILEDHSGGELQRNIFHYPTGLSHKMDELIQCTHAFRRSKIEIKASIEGYKYQIVLSLGQEELNTPVIETYAGIWVMKFKGSLYKGVVAGLRNALKSNTGKKIAEKNVRRGLLMLASVDGPQLCFSGATREKLDMPEVKNAAQKLVRRELSAWFANNPGVSDSIVRR